MTEIDKDFEVSLVNPPTIGGQHVGVPRSHVKVQHVPTGIYAVCSSERSQHKNRSVAMAMVQYGLAELGWGKP